MCLLVLQLVAEVVAKELERANVTENQSDELNTDDENEEEEVCLTSCDLIMSCCFYSL